MLSDVSVATLEIVFPWIFELRYSDRPLSRLRSSVCRVVSSRFVLRRFFP